MDLPTAKENSHTKRKDRNFKMHKKGREMHFKFEYESYDVLE